MRTSIESAEASLVGLEQTWGKQYPSVVKLWKNNWENIIPQFQFPPEIRKIIYTTNAIESLNASMRKYTRNRKIFPNDQAAHKALFLAIREASKGWKKIQNWGPALQFFQIMVGEERLPPSLLRC